MMKKCTAWMFAAVSFLCGCGAALAQDLPSYLATIPTNLPPPTNPTLRDELLAMVQNDQAIRQKIIANHNSPAFQAELEAIDGRDTARMRQIVAQYGWPTFRLVGLDGEGDAALLVQHADLDPTFQSYCLPLEKAAAANNEAMKPDVALLTDRVRLAQRKKQVYGTQFTWGSGTSAGEPKPLMDPAHVDQRRASMGLVPMAQYKQMLEQLYHLQPAVR